MARDRKPDPSELDQLRAVTEQVGPIPDDEWNFAASHIFARDYPRKALLLQAGDHANAFLFITTGLTRFFYVTESGRELNKHFAGTHDYVGSFMSLILNIPCPFNIEALEPTTVLVLTGELQQELFSRHAIWERVGRVNAEMLAIRKEIREKEFLLDSAETRYRRFLEEFSNLIDRIPQYHIASYLGITDVALSRIRKKMKAS